MGPATCRPVCYPVHAQTSQVCVTCTGCDSLGHRRPESTMGESGCLRLPSSLPAQPSDLQGNGSGPSQNVSDCSRLAQHALLLGPGQPVCSDSLQTPIAQEPQQSESACLAPIEPLPFKNKGSLTKWQLELRLLRDSQSKPFTNQSGPFLSNGVSQTRWTSTRPL